MDGLELGGRVSRAIIGSTHGVETRQRTYVVLGQQMERAEDLVVVELEAARGLEARKVIRVQLGLGDFLGAALGLVVAVGVLRRHARASTPSAVVAMGMRRVMLLLVVLMLVLLLLGMCAELSGAVAVRSHDAAAADDVPVGESFPVAFRSEKRAEGYEEVEVVITRQSRVAEPDDAATVRRRVGDDGD